VITFSSPQGSKHSDVYSANKYHAEIDKPHISNTPPSSENMQRFVFPVYGSWPSYHQVGKKRGHLCFTCLPEVAFVIEMDELFDPAYTDLCGSKTVMTIAYKL